MDCIARAHTQALPRHARRFSAVPPHPRPLAPETGAKGEGRFAPPPFDLVPRNGPEWPAVAMTVSDLRDLDQARLFVVQGLRWQQGLPATPATVGRALEWALEIAAGGQPLPPVCLVADLGHNALALDQGVRRDTHGPRLPGLPPE